MTDQRPAALAPDDDAVEQLAAFVAAHDGKDDTSLLSVQVGRRNWAHLTLRGLRALLTERDQLRERVAALLLHGDVRRPGLPGQTPPAAPQAPAPSPATPPVPDSSYTSSSGPQRGASDGEPFGIRIGPEGAIVTGSSQPIEPQQHAQPVYHFSPGYTGEIPNHHGRQATCAVLECQTAHRQHKAADDIQDLTLEIIGNPQQPTGDVEPTHYGPGVMGEPTTHLGNRATCGAPDCADDEPAPHVVAVTHLPGDFDMNDRKPHEQLIGNGVAGWVSHQVTHPPACHALPYGQPCPFDDEWENGQYTYDDTPPGLYHVQNRAHDVADHEGEYSHTEDYLDYQRVGDPPQRTVSPPADFGPHYSDGVPF